MTLELELIAQDMTAVRTAVEIGAVRVELCQALALGGLTPSLGTIRRAVARAEGEVEVHPLIRMRPGGFLYSDDEVEIMAADVRAAVAAGAAGVVAGCLDPGTGLFHLEHMKRLRDAAGEAAFSVHRAIDVTSDRLAALDQLMTLGAGRVLTSGGAATAAEGAAGLAALVESAQGRIAIMAGGGVTTETVAEIVATGVDAVHFSARILVPDGSGSAEVFAAGAHETVDPERAIAIAERARGAFAARIGGSLG